MVIDTIKRFVNTFDKKMKIEIQITRFGMPSYYGDEPEGYEPPPEVSTVYYTREQLDEGFDFDLQYYDFIEVYYDKYKHKTIIEFIQDFDDYYKLQKELIEYEERRKNSKTKVDNFMKSRIDIELERLKVLARKYEERR